MAVLGLLNRPLASASYSCLWCLPVLSSAIKMTFELDQKLIDGTLGMTQEVQYSSLSLTIFAT